MVGQKYAPFYRKWVNDALWFCRVDFGQAVDDFKKEGFLRKLAGEREDWQVKQAGAALDLYHFFERKK